MIGTLRQSAAWTFVAPFRAALRHGNQALITLASAYMNAQFAQSHNILDPWIAWALAVGYEWTYLRGLASAERTQSKWTVALNLVALGTAIIGGLLYCADRYGALPSDPDTWLAWLLSAAHVLPMALLSLCSAMVNRAAHATEVAQNERQAQAETDLHIERQKRLLDIEMRQAWHAGMQMHDANNARSPHQGAKRADADYACASCGSTLTMKQYAASKRWGRCARCPRQT